MQEFFRKFAHVTSGAVGSAWAFLLALGIVNLFALMQYQGKGEAVSPLYFH
jgi:hypothetical protein